MKVYVIEVKDYGDNGWRIEALFSTREAADEYLQQRVAPFGEYYELEEFEVDA